MPTQSAGRPSQVRLCRNLRANLFEVEEAMPRPLKGETEGLYFPAENRLNQQSALDWRLGGVLGWFPICPDYRVPSKPKLAKTHVLSSRFRSTGPKSQF